MPSTRISFAAKDVIVTGMLGWIATWAAREPIGTANGWCTGYGAQDNRWPLRSFYPDDLINAVIAGCTARAEAVLAKVAEARIQTAIAAAERSDRTLEAMVAAKWLPYARPAHRRSHVGPLDEGAL